ncbi:hypothetical protein LCGC14_1273230, partial [marine sediment metagenome]
LEAGPQYGSIGADATNIVMRRRTGGAFAIANYNATSFNRGWIFIWYAVP